MFFVLPSRVVLSVALLALGLLTPKWVYAHAEHDKARFVATDGVDTGRCDKPLRPCKTIAYAVQQANKGDKVLVAAGHYALNDEEQLFYFSSELVPVLGGYSRIDHFQLQAPQLNRTTLSGLPVELQSKLTERGFSLIRDGKAQLSDSLSNRLAALQSLNQSQAASQCVNGKAGTFSCNNIDLVGHMALTAFSSRPSAANDIWGHVDLNSGTEYALIGLVNGTAVVSLADPESPVEVGSIGGSRTSWRDIKVYQYFDQNLRRWQAYAYVSSEGSDGIQIIDLNHLPDAVSLAATYRGVSSSHNVFISGVDYSTNTANSGQVPLLHLAGQNTQAGAVTSLSLANPLQLTPVWQQNAVNAADYTHDVALMQINDGRAQSDCQRESCQILIDFNEGEVRLWDNTEASTPSRLALFSYDQASYVHSGWSSEDNRFLFVHDELDETSHNLNTTLRIFNLDNLQSPELAGIWRGGSRAIDHNGFVRGNRYYMSNYQRGLTVLDITNPAEPSEVGYFDTFVASDSAAFNGMWGTYPYLPSGLILGSDINSGLYVLADNSKTTSAGSVAFVSADISSTPGELVSIEVQRPQGAGAISVGYDSFAGSAVSGTDYQPVSGRLSWTADDNSSKFIMLTTLDSGEQAKRTVFVRLFDVQGGATLGAPMQTTVSFGTEPPRPGSLSLTQTALDVVESHIARFTVERIGGSDGEVRVAYATEAGSATASTDFADSTGTLIWADGETEAKVILIAVLDDINAEPDETFSLQLSSVNGSSLGANSRATVTILDNDANTAPTLSVGDNRQVNASQTVTLTATASDAQGDAISFQWAQLSGTAVTLQNAQTASMSFVAPATSGELTFSVSATDSRGASSNAQLAVRVVVPVQPNTSSSGGGSLSIYALFLLLLNWCRYRKSDY